MNLQTNQLGCMYGDRTIFENVSVQVGGRDRIGLVGVNGAGKSTLLKILAGIQKPDSGHLQLIPGLKLGYLPQQVHMDALHSVEHEMRTVLEPLRQMEKQLRDLETQMADPELHTNEHLWNRVSKQYDELSKQFAEADGYAMDAQLRSVLTGMKFPPEQWSQPIATLSGGQKTRLGLAKLLLQKPDLLLLDEPTNHLDLETLEWLENYLGSFPGAIISVSHDRYFLDASSKMIWEIENGKVSTYKGDYTRYTASKAAERELQGYAFNKQQEQISKLEEFIQRNIARASTSKRAKSRRNQLDAMDRVEAPTADPTKVALRFPPTQRTGKDVLNVQQLKLIEQTVSFHICRGESVTILGPNGVGKTTLLRKLRDCYDNGSPEHADWLVKWGSGVKPGYYDQELSNLQPDLTVLETVWSAFAHLEEKVIRGALGRLHFSGDDVKRTIRGLSGGEKARVVWCLLMLTEPNVLLLDEPTNHLDLWTREAVEDALLEFDGTMLMISHDRYFLNKIGDRVLYLDPKNLTSYEGTYDDVKLQFEQKKVRELERLQKETAEQNKSTSNTIHRETSREQRQQRRKLEQLEHEIAALEERSAELEAICADETIAADYAKWKQADQELKDTQSKLLVTMEEWSILSDTL